MANDSLYEKHHVVPRSLGGTDDSSNIIRLTPREHYIAHRLLYHASIYSNNKRIYWKQVYSLNAFHVQQDFKKRPVVMPARVVERIRILIKEHLRELPPHNKGKPHDERVRQKMKDNHYLKNGGIHPMLNRNHNEESKKKMSVNSAKWWCKAVSPDGDVTICKSTHELARLVGTNTDTIRKFCNTNEPVPAPPTRYVSQSTPERLAANGWLFYRQEEPFDK